MIWEPSPRLKIRSELRASTIPGAGDGLFALEPAETGRWLGIGFPDEDLMCTAEEVLRIPAEQRRYAWRHVEHVCFSGVSHDRDAIAYANHDDDPNVHWHLGCLIARRDIAIGDELTIDYRPLFDPSWSEPLHLASGTEITMTGISWRDALLESARELVALLERGR